MQPRTEYAKSGDVHVAYQLLGEGPVDLVFVPGFVSHVEHFWEDPSLARFLRRLGSFSRLVFFDKRGTGLSDRVSEAAVAVTARIDLAAPEASQFAANRCAGRASSRDPRRVPT